MKSQETSRGLLAKQTSMGEGPMEDTLMPKSVWSLEGCPIKMGFCTYLSYIPELHIYRRKDVEKPSCNNLRVYLKYSPPIPRFLGFEFVCPRNLWDMKQLSPDHGE